MNPEELSFRNLVEFEREDLVRLLNGEYASKIFTETHHKTLIKLGVVIRYPTLRRTLPTEKAMEVLGIKIDY